MSVSATATSTGFIPRICAICEEEISTGYRIAQVDVEIFAKPFFQENDKWVCTHSYNMPITYTFVAAFNKDACSVDLINKFNEIRKELWKMGSFVEVTFKAVITSVGTIDIHKIRATRIKRIEGETKDYLNSPGWEKTFGYAQEPPLQKQQQARAQESVAAIAKNSQSE